MAGARILTAACPYCSGHAPFMRASRTTWTSKTTWASLVGTQQPLRKPVAASRPAVRRFATVVHDDGGFVPRDDDSRGRSPNHSSSHNHNHNHNRSGAEDGRRPRRPAPVLPWPTTPDPTPYDVLHQTKGAPYVKTRFYELAKQYHPDRHLHAPAPLHHLSAATRLERYRLVVAANDILSDPDKRRLYDRYGTGWGDGPAEDAHNTACRAAEQAWRQQANTASGNATWEDWERWNKARNSNGPGSASQAAPPSNVGFVLTVLLFVFLGGWGRLAHAASSPPRLLEAHDQQHQAISRTLQEQQCETAQLSREDRVGSFLVRRVGSGYDLPPASPAVEERRRRRRAARQGQLEEDDLD
ncbi:Heat shock protein DnaJ [Niveomyces insectorum RCEF 264]|uniref:Heat shock protein DnaJ n=1 Tax=Niveomyces insectorum RCEF 264 TaxID=1081102 RepID=A0A162J8C9_9HYPO|nr:Heat shock protein DnaJ [Niveomyces insectorum RCEF 264]